MRKQSAMVDSFRRPKTPAEVLSDTALDLAIREVDISLATIELLGQADHNRELMASGHTVHVQRMAFRPSGDFVYQRALRIIEATLRQIPRSEKPPINWASSRPGFLRRLRSRMRSVPALDEPSQ